MTRRDSFLGILGGLWASFFLPFTGKTEAAESEEISLYDGPWGTVFRLNIRNGHLEQISPWDVKDGDKVILIKTYKKDKTLNRIISFTAKGDTFSMDGKPAGYTDDSKNLIVEALKAKA